MSRSYSAKASEGRPVGIRIAAGALYVLAGVGAGLFVLWDVAGMVQGRTRPGIPIMLVVKVSVLAIALVVPARGLLNRRRWAWFTVLLYVVAVGVGALGLAAVAGIDAVMTSVRIAAVTPFLKGIMITAVSIVTVCGLSYAYFMQPSIHHDWFGIDRTRAWLGMASQFLGCVLLTAGLVFAGLASIQEHHVAELAALGERSAGDDNAVEVMVERLENGSDQERAVAAWALGRTGRDDVDPHLVRAARQDHDAQVRVNAITALFELDVSDFELFDAALSDSNEDVRDAVVLALADPRFVELRGSVERRLFADSDRVRASAAYTLGLMGDADAVPALIEAATCDDNDTLSSVAFSLGKLGDNRAIPALTVMLDDSRWDVRANAAQALGMLGDDSATAILRDHVKDGDERVRHAVLRAMARLEGEARRNPLTIVDR